MGFYLTNDNNKRTREKNCFWNMGCLASVVISALARSMAKKL